MAKYCSKCGEVISEGSKFCKKCGASVNSQMEKKSEVVKVKKNKVWIPVVVIAVAIIGICITLFSGVASNIGVPAYEKPLKTQIDAINKRDTEKYLSSFSSKVREYHESPYLINYMKEVKKASYKVQSTEDISSAYLLSDLAISQQSISEISAAKKMKVEYTFELPGGGKKTMTDTFYVIEMNGEWSAVNGTID